MSKMPPLETNDDGLPMREKGGKWTYNKLYFLNAYFGRFIVSMRNRQWKAINYIDLFAGPGKNKLPDGRIILGSPLLALSQKRSFDHYYFSDIDPSNISVLKQRCAQYSMPGRISSFPDDANRIVDRVVYEIKQTQGVYTKGDWPCLNLAFLDPEGMELHWETVAKLASLRTDMIIYYPQMGITRDAPAQIQENNPTSIDEFFGDTTWREIYQRHQNGEESFLHRALLDLYKQKFSGFGYKVEEPISEPVFKNKRDAPLYRLLFVSKHELGNKFWADVIENLPDGQMRLI